MYNLDLVYKLTTAAKFWH